MNNIAPLDAEYGMTGQVLTRLYTSLGETAGVFAIAARGDGRSLLVTLEPSNERETM